MPIPNTGGVADAIASVRSVSERELMLYSAAAVWASTALGMLVAGIAKPELSPEHVWAGRIAFTTISLIVVVSTLTWMRRLDNQRVAQAMFVVCTMSALMNMAIMMINPLAIGGHCIALLALAVFAAHFLELRAAVAQVLLITACALLPVLVFRSEVESAHLLARAGAFVPIMWAVAIAVYLLHRNRLATVAEGTAVADADSLTGVANVRAFERHASEVLADRNARIAGSTALLLIDLDEFKHVNTLYGHAGGDHVLRTVATGLQNASSESHTVARIGGDEFAVLIENVTPGDLPDLAIRYRNAVLAASVNADLEDVALDASVGSAITNGDHLSLPEMLTVADRRMYADKAIHAASADTDHRADQPIHLVGEFNTPETESAQGPAAAPQTFGLRWSQRPAHARLLGLAWAVGATIGLLSLAIPDADRTHFIAAVAVLIGAYGFAAIAYVSAPAIGSWRHLANDVLALATIALLAYLTGGADSPLWPLVFIFIIYQAWFMHARQIWFRLVGPLVVILAPLLYEHGDISVAAGAALYTGVLVAFGLTIAMSYNQFLIDRAQRRTALLATLDPRTGLASRLEFERHAQHALDDPSDDREESLTIVMLDLDNFKNVNTRHGHAEGDRLLQQVAASLAACARSTDCVARIGGDEFAVAMSQVSPEVAQTLTRRFVDAVTECTGHSEFSACREVSASAGFALHGRHGATLDELINAADVALMSVKTSGKGVERISGAVA